MARTPETDLDHVAIERANDGGVPVDALLAALRRAAEDDGVDDVDDVVAEFATFVRARAPQLVAASVGRRQGSGWTTAVLTAGALTTAAFGAVAGGLVANPLTDRTGTNDALTDTVTEAAAAPPDVVSVDGAATPVAPTARTGASTGAVDDPAPLGPVGADALAMIEAQQGAALGDTAASAPTEGATPIESTEPTEPTTSSTSTTSTTTPDPASPAVTAPPVTAPPLETTNEQPYNTPSTTDMSLDDQGGAG